MSVSGLSNTVLNYQAIGGLGLPSAAAASTAAASASAVAAVGNTQSGNGSGSATGSAGSNNSSLAAAITQALQQMNPTLDLSSLLSGSGQQASSDFMSNLYSVLPQLSGDSSSSASTGSSSSLQSLLSAASSSSSSSSSVAPVKLDSSSATYNLQNGIQQLISNLGGSGSSGIDSLLGGGSSDSSNGLFSASGLQSAFNKLVSSSGGNPSQANLQSFLKLVAVNIQGSTSIGSLFDTSA